MTEHRFHRIRAFNIAALALLLPAAVADIAVGMSWLAAFLALLWCGNLVSAVCNTQRIHHARASARRPDYAAIARMERDIWGHEPGPRSLMNGGTDAGVAGWGSFPVGSERELAEAKQRLMRLLRC